MGGWVTTLIEAVSEGMGWQVSRRGTRKGWRKVKERYRIGIPADLHTPQLQPAPVRIQLCGPVYKH